MRILITGGAGFIGTNLVLRLTDAGIGEVVVVDNLSIGRMPPWLRERVEFLFGDFRDATLMRRALKGIDVIVHLAALSGVVDSVIDPRPSFETNIVGSFQLLELARQSSVKRFIFASTGGALVGNVTPPISEAMPPSPLSPYGATKLALEGYCAAFSASYGLHCTTLRFSNIYGPHSAHKKSVVASFVKRTLRKEPLVIYGDGTQQRDYLYVGDLTQGIQAAITGDSTGTFQLGSGKPTSLLRLVSVLEAVAATNLPICFEEARRGEVHSTWCDIAKAAREFGFSAPTAIEEGVEQTWGWFRDNFDEWKEQKFEFSSD